MQPLKIPPWMSLILAAVFNTLAMLSLANIFTPGSKAAVAVMIVNAVLFNVLALLGVPIVGGKAVVNSVTVTTTQDPAPLPPPPSGPQSLRLLPFLLLAGLGMSACATGPKIAYESLGAMSNWVRVAAEELPPSCATILAAELKASKTEAENNAVQAKTIAQCDQAKAALKSAAGSIRLAYDGVRDLAAGSKSPKDLTAWIRLAVDLYTDLTGVLDPLGVKLPVVK